jgi:hypothetical protein
MERGGCRVGEGRGREREGEELSVLLRGVAVDLDMM